MKHTQFLTLEHLYLLKSTLVKKFDKKDTDIKIVKVKDNLLIIFEFSKFDMIEIHWALSKIIDIYDSNRICTNAFKLKCEWNSNAVAYEFQLESEIESTELYFKDNNNILCCNLNEISSIEELKKVIKDIPRFEYLTLNQYKNCSEVSFETNNKIKTFQITFEYNIITILNTLKCYDLISTTPNFYLFRNVR